MKPLKSSKPKRPRGRPSTRIIKLNATPEQVRKPFSKLGDGLTLPKPNQAWLAFRISPENREHEDISRTVFYEKRCKG